MRLGLRTLVVGGIAGAAWLFSAAAAHAAEPETPTEAAHRGLSVLSLDSDLGTEVVGESAHSLVGELLTPAAENTAVLPLDHLHGTGATARNTTAMPARQPVEADAPAPSERTHEPFAPLRLTGGPTGSTQTGIAAANTTPTRAPASAAVTGMRLGSEPERAARPAPVAEPPPLVDAPAGVPGQLPGAPLPLALVKGAAGGASGAPAGGPGVTTDGGSSAVVSAVVMGTMGAASRPAAPADVVVPRRDAEAPAVSPD